jgi:hypothetical protein
MSWIPYRQGDQTNGFVQDKRVLESEVYVLKAQLADANEALRRNADAYAILDTIEASMEKPLPELEGYEVRSSPVITDGHKRNREGERTHTHTERERERDRQTKRKRERGVCPQGQAR